MAKNGNTKSSPKASPAATSASKPKSSPKAALRPVEPPVMQADDFESIKLIDIDTNKFENSRSGKYVESEGTADGERGQSFDELVEAIRAEGQLQPVIVRPSSTKGRFDLIAGFRRYYALEQIAKEAGNGAEKIATIKAIVKHGLTPFRARAINLYENTSRDDLRPPDVAFGLMDLQREAFACGENPSIEYLASLVGKKQSYGSRLIKIMKNTDPKITTHWRDQTVQLTVSQMEQVAEMPKADQHKAYNALISGKAVDGSESGAGGGNGRPEGSGRGPGGWVVTAQKKAYELGAVFKMLGVAPSLTAEHVKAMGNLGYFKLGGKGKPATAAQIKQIIGSCVDGWNDYGKDGEPAESADE